MKILIKDGHVINSRSGISGMLDVLVDDGKIVELAPSISVQDAHVIDAKDKIVMPGLVDAHCHLRDPGLEYKEDIQSGTRSAALGGFTSIACMPNTIPVIDNKVVVSYVIAKAKEVGVVRVYPIGAISKGEKGEELAEMGLMKEAGAVAFSDDGKPVRSAGLMKKAMIYAASLGSPVISHCEDMDIAEDGVMNEGVVSTALGLKGIPAAAEEVMVAREVVLSEYLGVPVHIAHISTGLGVDIVRHAKARGVRVTAETCPHFFSITEEVCQEFNTLGKVNPPLRTACDVKEIIEGLKDGTIDVIATDHAPHHEDEKNVEFNLAANGMVGFETAFPLSYTNLVKPGHLDLHELVDRMSTRPAALLGIQGGIIKAGVPADITIADLNPNVYRRSISTCIEKQKFTFPRHGSQRAD